MTRQHDKALKKDRGVTEASLLAQGYLALSNDFGQGMRMRKDESIKFQCDSCSLLFDEVVVGYMFSQSCWHCRHRK
jgi:hypothetical protein